MPMPAAYVIRKHQVELAALLDRHDIAYQILAAPRTCWGVEFANRSAGPATEESLGDVEERVMRITASPGDLWVDLAQPRGRLAALLLEPRSTSSLWRTREILPFVSADKALPIYRIAR
jgi:hypothetical protein